MKLLNKAGTIFDGINNALAFLGISTIIFLMLLISTEIIMRRFLGQSIFWAVEISEYSLIYLPFLGAAWLLRKDGHVGIDLVVNHFGASTQSAIYLVNSIVSVLVCLAITWYGIVVTWDYIQLGYTIPTLLEPPKWIVIVIIPVGAFLLSIQFLRKVRGYLKDLR